MCRTRAKDKVRAGQVHTGLARRTTKRRPAHIQGPQPDPNSGYGAHCALRKAEQPQTNVTHGPPTSKDRSPTQTQATEPTAHCARRSNPRPTSHVQATSTAADAADCAQQPKTPKNLKQTGLARRTTKRRPAHIQGPRPDPNSGYGAHCALRKAEQPQTNVTRTGDVNSCGCYGLRSATQNPKNHENLKTLENHKNPKIKV
ncbi:hypothetical protein PCASD_23496 [Puccinia coronata f. sp. avenae]|uniref:Uncharacterized protein n=1 Tax=Puccinia coronata f. sp. avenae TaxID=200324 RepID=A0A2N5TNN5_9BASI|nr:hypothetical protein PCASD_23496 [Puccinia coronata f. sp. avenae]